MSRRSASRDRGSERKREIGHNGCVLPSPDEPGAEAPARCILLVEDNAQVGAMYERVLHRLPMPGGLTVRVESAQDGAQALSRLEQGPEVALVVTDLYMPVMDGFSLLERIRSHPRLRRTPVLAITAAGADGRERALELGADVCLSKPVKIREILGSVSALLGVPG
jgi:CheY-like chemotaxis protein